MIYYVTQKEIMIDGWASDSKKLANICRIILQKSEAGKIIFGSIGILLVKKKEPCKYADINTYR